MPVVLIQDMPSGRREITEAVVKQMDIEHDPPAGMLVHTATERPGGGIRIVDVWENKEAHEAFFRDRLSPALETVLPQFGADMSLMGDMTQDWQEAFDLKISR